MKFNLNSLLENKIVLYVIFFLSLATVFGYIVLNNYPAVLFFILLAFLTNYFSKNMILILGSAILGTHLLAVLNVFGNTREGFKEGMGKIEEKAEVVPEEEKEEEKEEVVAKGVAKRVVPEKHTNNPGDGKNVQSSFVNMGATKKLESADIVPSVDNVISKDDKAKATEKAHDLLESALGKENVRNMAIDTKELIKRQTELMDEMKKITPILSQTMGMVGNLDLGGLTDMFDKVTDMMPGTKSE